MNIILRCAFGLELDAYSNKNNPVAEKINKASDELLASFAMKSPVEVFFFQFFFFYFPGIMNLIPMWPQAYDDLWKISDGIMKVNMLNLFTGQISAFNYKYFSKEKALGRTGKTSSHVSLI